MYMKIKTNFGRIINKPQNSTAYTLNSSRPSNTDYFFLFFIEIPGTKIISFYFFLELKFC